MASVNDDNSEHILKQAYTINKKTQQRTALNATNFHETEQRYFCHNNSWNV